MNENSSQCNGPRRQECVQRQFQIERFHASIKSSPNLNVKTHKDDITRELVYTLTHPIIGDVCLESNEESRKDPTYMDDALNLLIAAIVTLRFGWLRPRISLKRLTKTSVTVNKYYSIVPITWESISDDKKLYTILTTKRL